MVSIGMMIGWIDTLSWFTDPYLQNRKHGKQTLFCSSYKHYQPHSVYDKLVQQRLCLLKEHRHPSNTHAVLYFCKPNKRREQNEEGKKNKVNCQLKEFLDRFPQKLPSELQPQKLPKHIAVIMDGNGRWGHKHYNSRTRGHKEGAVVLWELIACCLEWNITAVTVFAFSSENWKRPSEEVNFLFYLFQETLATQLEALVRANVYIKFIGNIAKLPVSLQNEIAKAEKLTCGNKKLKLTIAMNYSGRQDIVHITQRILKDIEQGNIDSSQVNEDLFTEYIQRYSITDPDLLIRTAGEMRLSNFLLWQVAYTELYITETLWPDFTWKELYQACLQYQRRERKYGGLLCPDKIPN
eukprot:jgi/Galph1/1637/GphlegSOOS_G312.1